jgi:hypothetical protein
MEGGLWGWIVAPIFALALLLCIILMLPFSDCGESTEYKEAVPLIFVALAILGVVGAGGLRVTTMVRRRRFRMRDGLILVAASIVLAMSSVLLASPNRGVFGWLVPGILLLTGISLSGLIVAATAGRSVDAVGILLPIYLFGAAFVYVILGWFVAAANNGAFC